MFLEPKDVLRTKTRFLEHKPDVIKQDSPGLKCSKNISCRPQKVLRTLSGGAIGEPGRFATA
eukprot:5010321-Pyramimonas_sp.AAC.1